MVAPQSRTGATASTGRRRPGLVPWPRTPFRPKHAQKRRWVLFRPRPRRRVAEAQGWRMFKGYKGEFSAGIDTLSTRHSKPTVQDSWNGGRRPDYTNDFRRETHMAELFASWSFPRSSYPQALRRLRDSRKICAPARKNCWPPSGEPSTTRSMLQQMCEKVRTLTGQRHFVDSVDRRKKPVEYEPELDLTAASDSVLPTLKVPVATVSCQRRATGFRFRFDYNFAGWMY